MTTVLFQMLKWATDTWCPDNLAGYRGKITWDICKELTAIYGFPVLTRYRTNWNQSDSGLHPTDLSFLPGKPSDIEALAS